MCYKNIYSNERRHRFGLTDSNLCVGCGQIETVTHQLFECSNAVRLWNMFNGTSGTNVGSFQDLILGSDIIELEVIKAVIIKALIQINRNHNVPVRMIARECAYFLRIEAILNPSLATTILDLVTKLNNVA